MKNLQETRIENLKNALKAKNAVKVIAGIANFDETSVLGIVRATEAAKAHAVDIAADASLVRAARQATEQAIFASSVSPQALADAVEAGADVAELGNFDALYAKGLFLSADDVLTLAKETLSKVAGRALVSITVPGHLNVDAQIALAQQLELLGVDMIQTEGTARVLATEPTVKTLSQPEQEALTLRNTRALTAAVSIPVITASGIQADNANRAFEAGASAVGVGTYVRQAISSAEMVERIMAVMANTQPTPLRLAV